MTKAKHSKHTGKKLSGFLKVYICILYLATLNILRHMNTPAVFR